MSRKFNVPHRTEKKAYPRAMYLGEEVYVNGVQRLDEAQRVYYTVKPVNKRNSDTIAVRCDKLDVIM